MKKIRQILKYLTEYDCGYYVKPKFYDVDGDTKLGFTLYKKYRFMGFPYYEKVLFFVDIDTMNTYTNRNNIKMIAF